MLNPYTLLFALAMAIGLFGSGVSVGYRWSERSHAAALAAVQNAAIEGANRATEVEVERVRTAAEAEAKARLAFNNRKHKGELDAAKKSRPVCARDVESMGLLNDAIDSANGDTAAPGILLEPVSANGKAGGWLGVFGTKLGISGAGSIPPVSNPP